MKSQVGSLAPSIHSSLDRERPPGPKQREREIDGVATEAVRPDLDDSCCGSIPRHRRGRRVECSDRPDEKRGGKNRDHDAEQHCQSGNGWDRSSKMQCRASENGSHISGDFFRLAVMAIKLSLLPLLKIHHKRENPRRNLATVAADEHRGEQQREDNRNLSQD